MESASVLLEIVWPSKAARGFESLLLRQKERHLLSADAVLF